MHNTCICITRMSPSTRRTLPGSSGFPAPPRCSARSSRTTQWSREQSSPHSGQSPAPAQRDVCVHAETQDCAEGTHPVHPDHRPAHSGIHVRGSLDGLNGGDGSPLLHNIPHLGQRHKDDVTQLLLCIVRHPACCSGPIHLRRRAFQSCEWARNTTPAHKDSVPVRTRAPWCNTC